MGNFKEDLAVNTQTLKENWEILSELFNQMANGINLTTKCDEYTLDWLNRSISAILKLTETYNDKPKEDDITGLIENIQMAIENINGIKPKIGDTFSQEMIGQISELKNSMKAIIQHYAEKENQEKIGNVKEELLKIFTQLGCATQQLPKDISQIDSNLGLAELQILLRNASEINRSVKRLGQGLKFPFFDEPENPEHQ